MLDLTNDFKSNFLENEIQNISYPEFLRNALETFELCSKVLFTKFAKSTTLKEEFLVAIYHDGTLSKFVLTN